jgi:manganese transport system ATP-binding protein
MGAVLTRADDLGRGRRGNEAVASSAFELPTGAVTAVIGPNGSGKSTLLHALAGLLEPLAGSIEVLGTTPAQARPRLGYVLQSVTVPAGTPITVKEAVGMGRYPSLGLLRRRRSDDRDRVRRAMDLLDVADLAGRHLTELSGGQRQRVYVAQGLAQDHDALLMDEPLTGLDLVSARVIDEIVHTERERGHAVVLTTHDLEEARAAEHVVLMSGRVVASGPPAQVLTRQNLEVAYGLGALHEASGDFIDDPAEPHGHA